MTAEWKNQIATRANDATRHELVEDVVAELLDNLGITDSGLPAYGVRKVAHYAACVAIAQALGIDPDLMRLSADEANSALLEKAAQAVFAGVPVYTIDLTPGDPS